MFEIQIYFLGVRIKPCFKASTLLKIKFANNKWSVGPKSRPNRLCRNCRDCWDCFAPNLYLRRTDRSLEQWNIYFVNRFTSERCFTHFIGICICIASLRSTQSQSSVHLIRCLRRNDWTKTIFNISYFWHNSRYEWLNSL